MEIQFIKFHGYGNDYIVIESEQLVEVSDLGEFARRICDRHYGAGADGIAVVSRAEIGADFYVRIFNPDGSEAGLSGNGTRCAAAYLYYRDLWRADELRLNTRSGVKRYFLRERLVNYPLLADGQSFNVTALQIGNPNCCIFVEDFKALDWRRIGRAIENHQQFPERTNVVFVRVLDRRRIELRIWERGVGETTASGTCSCAAAVASMINGFTDRQINVSMAGGEVKIQWREDGEVVLTGTAEIVYRGEWLGW